MLNDATDRDLAEVAQKDIRKAILLTQAALADLEDVGPEVSESDLRRLTKVLRHADRFLEAEEDQDPSASAPSALGVAPGALRRQAMEDARDFTQTMIHVGTMAYLLRSARGIDEHFDTMSYFREEWAKLIDHGPNVFDSCTTPEQVKRLEKALLDVVEAQRVFADRIRRLLPRWRGKGGEA
jgi:hypothetical protein